MEIICDGAGSGGIAVEDIMCSNNVSKKIQRSMSCYNNINESNSGVSGDDDVV